MNSNIFNQILSRPNNLNQTHKSTFILQFFALQVNNNNKKKFLLHSFLGSSDRSLQSFTLSHTLLPSMHSPFLQRNFRGPSHFVAIAWWEEKKTTDAY